MPPSLPTFGHPTAGLTGGPREGGLINSVPLFRWVLDKDEGTPEMSEVSDAIREGADGFFVTMWVALHTSGLGVHTKRGWRRWQHSDALWPDLLQWLRYGLISKLAVVVAAAIYAIYAFRQATPDQVASLRVVSPAAAVPGGASAAAAVAPLPPPAAAANDLPLLGLITDRLPLV